MLTWTWLDDSSVPAWAVLTSALATADGTNEFYEAEDLAEELTETGFDPVLDSWAVWDGAQLVAYGQLRVGSGPQEDGTVRCQLDGGVLPRWRGRGIGRVLLSQMETRAAELSAHRNPGLPFHLRASGGLEGSSASRLLSRSGYRVVRWFTDMERSLPGPDIPEAPICVPAPTADTGATGAGTPFGSSSEPSGGGATAGQESSGIVVVSPTLDDEEAVRLAHNAAFADHYGFAPHDVDRWRDLVRGRPARPEFSTLVKGHDGSVLAYVLAQQYAPHELYIALVGTVREARGRGLARLALSRTLDLARRDGSFTVVELSVDSESPTGADRLYTSLGFTVARSTQAMRKDPPVG
ncbi:GNAT family N-acetyltransferase [Tessaracoccus palaemonis]|uniref:GNAT family N-acetyltransferase n=1 Tax=Tessaracoccus palaemonis TaxID=2829499 RepID=A0ABX8SJM6_9ACTN|nr:GNAT family N-acetyltransferase [Tessaracoccus palaemonis]QXT63533.1 GNAT family N-acetyltransferase [Tessaracoccus palaemonis]